MDYLPLLKRELRVALRAQKPVQSRLKVAAAGAGGSILILLFGALLSGRNQGRLLAQLLCLAGLYCVLRTPQLTAGALAEERRNQTLGLLYISGLSVWEVFAGKFLSAALMTFTYLLALFPMLALPFLAGGISFDHFVATAAGLPVLVFFVLSISLLASVFTQDESGAIALCFLILSVLCIVTPAIFYAQSYFAPNATPSSGWLLLSPAYGPKLVWNGLRTGFGPAAQADFWRNLGVTLTLSFMAIGIAAIAFKRLWREQEIGMYSTGWRQRFHEWLHGSRFRRQHLAKQWLDNNPYTWLAARDRQPAALAWLLLGGITLLWLLCWACWPAHWPSVANSFITATLLNSVLTWLQKHAAAREFGLARRDGAFETLLTTPLTPLEIVHGTLAAIRLQFRRSANLVLALNVFLLAGALVTRDWTGRTLSVFAIVSSVLLGWSWLLRYDTSGLVPVMWAGVNCGRPALAVWKASGFNTWSWVWILFNAQSLGRGLRGFPSGSTQELMIVSAVAMVLFAVWVSKVIWNRTHQLKEMKWNPKKKQWLEGLAGPLQLRLIKEFREIVQEPVPDPKDPRFKQWDVKERFPWG
jgi:hypothetical protein